MKKLLNKTILRNCKYYKVRKYNSATTYNFTAEELAIFKQKNDILLYFVIKPSRQKAAKIYNLLCDIIAFFCFSLALILLIDIISTTL